MAVEVVTMAEAQFQMAQAFMATKEDASIAVGKSLMRNAIALLTEIYNLPGDQIPWHLAAVTNARRTYYITPDEAAHPNGNPLPEIGSQITSREFAQNLLAPYITKAKQGPGSLRDTLENNMETLTDALTNAIDTAGVPISIAERVSGLSQNQIRYLETRLSDENTNHSGVGQARAYTMQALAGILVAALLLDRGYNPRQTADFLIAVSERLQPKTDK